MIDYNIYCDESCHLENDKHKAMVLGAVWCEKEERQYLFNRIKEIKVKHGFNSNFELKWNKVSISKIDFYKEIVNFFFDSDKLNFRALVVANKNELDHEKFNQTHDLFYYKIYFDMLKIIISPKDRYDIYLDIKDTQGYEKVNKLHEVINNNNYDFSNKIVKRIQEVDSKQVSLIQMADLLIGALSYLHRGLSDSKAKLEIIDLIRKRSTYSLLKNTLPSERKFNLLFGNPDIEGEWQMNIYKLPELIELNEFGGDFSTYLEAVYQIFKNDFVDCKPKFNGVRLGLKKYPLIEGKEYTFYHMTHEGDIENERIPDLRRMERISWPRPLIDDSKQDYIKVWRNIRRGRGGTKNRILILHEQEKYLVILDDRGKYILPWTAYLIKGERSMKKKLREYENYKKAEAAN